MQLFPMARWRRRSLPCGGLLPAAALLLLSLLLGSAPSGWSSILPDSNAAMCQLAGPARGLAPWAGPGVQCEDGEVVEVQLSYWNLTGSLPAAWSSFSMMTTLDLSFNKLTGTLPGQWSQLSHLQVLKVRNNSLTGPLPTAWSALRALEKLDTRKNRLSGTIPRDWLGMTALRQMMLGANIRLRGQLQSVWTELKALVALGLGASNMSGSLPPEWSRLTGLIYMDLSRALLTGPAPPQWSTLTGLQLLHLNDNVLTHTLPAQWSTMQNLRAFSLDGASMAMTGTLPAEWSTMSAIISIGAGGNSLHGTLPREWSIMTNLNELYLEDNSLGGRLPTEWSTFRKAGYVYLSDNRLSGTLPPEWSTLPTFNLFLHNNRLSGSLPRQWSAQTNLIFLTLTANGLVGWLPSEWSSLTGLELLNIAMNQLSGPLPVSWSTLTNVRRMGFVQNALAGTIPPEWDKLLLERMEVTLLDFNLLSGQLPPWPRPLSGIIPPVTEPSPNSSGTPELGCGRGGGGGNSSNLTGSLSTAATEYEYTAPLAGSSGSPLPASSLLGVCGNHTEEGSYLTDDTAAMMDSYGGDYHYDYYYSSGGTTPPHLAYHVYGEDGDLYGGYYIDTGSLYYEFPLTDPHVIGVTFNRLAGPVPPANMGENVTVNFVAEFNCGLYETDFQRFCPSSDLWKWLTLSLLLLPFLAGLVLLSRRGRHRFFADVNFAVRRVAWRHVKNKTVMLIVSLALAWDLFARSPEYQVALQRMCLRLPADIASMSFVILGNFGSTLQLPAVAVLIAWWMWRTAQAYMGRPDVSAWTLMASKDVMRENLWMLWTDQKLLLTLFSCLAALCGVINYIMLPTFIIGQSSVPAPVAWFPPAMIKLQQQVPRLAVALFIAAYVLLVYQMVSNVSLPRHLWHSECVRVALQTSRQLSVSKGMLTQLQWPQECDQAGAAADSSDMLALLRPIRWLRYSPAVTALMMVTLLTCGAASTVSFIRNTRLEVEAVTYDDRGEVVLIPAETLSTILGLICLVVEVALLALLNVSAWWGSLDDVTALSLMTSAALPSNSSGCGGKRQGRLLPAVGKLLWHALRSLVSAGSMGRSHLRRNLLLAVFGLGMLPDVGRISWGLPLVLSVWTLTCILLVCVMIARDRPQSFDDLAGRPGFGLVMLARDLAEALEADLVDGKPLASSDGRTYRRRQHAGQKTWEGGGGGRDAGAGQRSLPNCCQDNPGGCSACVKLIRRFPATLFRMEETLALSYRWQSSKHMPVCPDGMDPNSPGLDLPYFLNGAVSVNMSRWQRQQLLSILQSCGHSYVWVDALCIPASLHPEPGTSLAITSGILLTRMMALYSAAATTLVLRSVEEPGLRYHQRAWTMQEFCCARELIVRSEDPGCAEEQLDIPGGVIKEMEMVGKLGEEGGAGEAEAVAEPPNSHGACSHTSQEEEQFRIRRAAVTERIVHALPFWVRRMRWQTTSALPEDLDLLRQGVSAYAEAGKQVSCEVLSDLVRALFPMFTNTSVQDEGELQALVQWAQESISRSEATFDTQEALNTAMALLLRPAPTV